MNFINSQYINTDLTHCTVEDDYISMRENGIHVRMTGDKGLIYKPPGFWISVNYGWEEWSGAENFQQDRDVQCNVFIKPNLTFIRISTVDEANELIRFLLPNMRDYNPGFHFEISDLIQFSHYEFEQIKKGKKVNSGTTWNNALNSCDGIYYENSWELHMNTIFNTWDCDSLVLFDPSNVLSIMKKDKIH